jgi:hypothetical protein
MNVLPVTFLFKIEKGKLVVYDKSFRTKLDLFVKSIPEGTIIEGTFEVDNADHSYAQLCKLHKCIRELAAYTGETFDDMKHYVKDKAGLKIDNTYKSFAKCSKEELSAAIQSTIEIGNLVGFPLE